MSLALILGCVWVIAAAGTALLPMRRQFAPGIALLLTAPVLLIWLGRVEGWGFAAFGLFALLSMFRRPLRHLAARALGRPSPDLGPPHLDHPELGHPATTAFEPAVGKS